MFEIIGVESKVKLNLLSNKYKGKLIVFTGVDGSGKTTLLNMAEKYLKYNGVKIYKTKMPSDRIRELDVFRNFHDSFDKEVREQVDVFSLTVLVSGDRLVVMDTEVIPALERGEWVLCDRYCYSGNIRCKDKLITSISERFIKPDIVFVANAAEDVVKKRVMQRENERNLYYDDIGVSQQITKYLEMAQENDFVVINTEQELNSVENEIKRKLAKILCL